jgi:tetratricopeptide (TPR) repeat protein
MPRGEFKEAAACFAACPGSCQLGEESTSAIELLMASLFGSIYDQNFSQFFSEIERAKRLVSELCDSDSPLLTHLQLMNASGLRLANRLEDAYDVVETIGQRSPASADVLLVKADILLDAGDFAGAINGCQKVLGVDPKNRDAIEGCSLRRRTE